MYVMRCQEKSLIDFADMLPMAIDLLKRRPDILQQYRALYRFVMVDEYQDIDAGQFELLMLIAREHGNVTVCGDDDQVRSVSFYFVAGNELSDLNVHFFP
jgi:DNA helicase-2/ATP-dependent DNA helicase PcrA